MKSLNHHKISFGHAWDGIKYALSSQPNFAVHLFFSSLAILAGLFFRLTSLEWILIIFTIFIGLVIELLNTSIESVVDLITSQWKQDAKWAKDTAAGAMLVYAIGAVIVAILIFFPKIN